MTPFNLAIVGLRLLAIYCFVQSIPLITTFGVIGALSRTEDPFGRSQASAVAMALLPGVALFVAAVLLYVFSVPLARRLSAVHPTENVESVCTFDQIQTVSFAVAGILILAFALPSVFRGVVSVIEFVRSKREGTVTPHQTYDTWLYCIGVVAQVVLGFLLFLNPRGFRNAWHWLRTART